MNGQTFDLLKEQSELEVAFEMEQTGDVHVELMSVDGESVVGAKVYSGRINRSCLWFDVVDFFLVFYRLH